MTDTGIPSTWATEESHKASARGWDVFDYGSEYQLQRDSDSEIFLTDHAAAAYVKGRALGDELAQKAIFRLASCGSDDIALFSLA